MSRGVNKVILVGNLGKDPEATNSKSGMEIAKISVATMNKVKDSSGEWKPETEWHRVVAFGSLAGIVIKYLKKGSKVYVEGRIKTNKWQDKDGQDRYTTEIIADQLQMLDSKSSDSSSPPSSYSENNSVIDDDIPF